MNSIHDICKIYNITNYTINDDGSIDVDGDVSFCRKGLTELPLTFNKVSGNFDCGDNNITTLKGCPRWIGGFFRASFTEITSLDFSPDYVDGYFLIIGCYGIKDNYCETEIRGGFHTTSYQDGLIIEDGDSLVTNYNEWRKLYKRKQTLNKLYTKF